MKAHPEKRLTRRFARQAEVEIRGHTRSHWNAKGQLVDCSEGGVGLLSPERMKRGEVVLLRVCAESARDTSRWPEEAGQFHMITAKVRWCFENFSEKDGAVYRVGVQRLLPFY